MASLKELLPARSCPDQEAAAPPERTTQIKPQIVTRSGEAERRLAQLTRTIEGEIIPRLMLAHRASTENAPYQAPAIVPDEKQVAHFAKLVLAHDVAAAGLFVGQMQAQGVLHETLLLDLFAPAARRLGEMWEEDICDFTEVTVGLSRLQQFLRQLSAAAEGDRAQSFEGGRRILLAPAPGEQHTFGICMVEDFFRRAGWDVWSLPGATARDLEAVVSAEPFAVAGLSVSGEVLIDQLTSGIRAIRRASLNRSIAIMVGGSYVTEHPQFVELIGADATAADGRDAVAQAEDLIGLTARRC